MANFHITEEGPKPCEAKVKACPVGGAHYSDRQAADAAFEEVLAKANPVTVLTKSADSLPELNTTGLKFGNHTIDGVEVSVGGAENINWRSDCSRCVSQGRTAFAPNHEASRSCQSGKRPHCTCDRCF